MFRPAFVQDRREKEAYLHGIAHMVKGIAGPGGDGVKRRKASAGGENRLPRRCGNGGGWVLSMLLWTWGGTAYFLLEVLYKTAVGEPVSYTHLALPTKA